jgi:predicted DNA-binding protein (UPF0278 family)
MPLFDIDYVGMAAPEQFEIELTSRIEQRWVRCFRIEMKRGVRPLFFRDRGPRNRIQ